MFSLVCPWPFAVSLLPSAALAGGTLKASVKKGGERPKRKVIDQAAGVPLSHLGGGRFLFPPAGWEISFDLSGRSVRRVTVHLIEGAIFRGKPRDVPGNRIEVRELTETDRRKYEGLYSSGELGVVYRVGIDEGELQLEHPRIGVRPLTHFSGDNFGLPGRQLRRIQFLREDPNDPHSEITGLIAEAFAWGVSIRFDRVEL